MWKNVFIESCILSALIFGGFYLNANLLKSEITASQETQNRTMDQYHWVHISGGAGSEYTQEVRNRTDHISGADTPDTREAPPAHLSGARQPTPPE